MRAYGRVKKGRGTNIARSSRVGRIWTSPDCLHASGGLALSVFPLVLIDVSDNDGGKQQQGDVSVLAHKIPQTRKICLRRNLTTLTTPLKG